MEKTIAKIKKLNLNNITLNETKFSKKNINVHKTKRGNEKDMETNDIEIKNSDDIKKNNISNNENDDMAMNNTQSEINNNKIKNLKKVENDENYEKELTWDTIKVGDHPSKIISYLQMKDKMLKTLIDTESLILIINPEDLLKNTNKILIRITKNLYVEQIDFSINNLRHDCCYIIQMKAKDIFIYIQWNGENTIRLQRAKATMLIHQMTLYMTKLEDPMKIKNLKSYCGNKISQKKKKKKKIA